MLLLVIVIVCNIASGPLTIIQTTLKVEHVGRCGDDVTDRPHQSSLFVNIGTYVLLT
jgi:hypothetical protein